ncbi:vasoactive intestinal polypeptide receptor 1 [Echinops telfairi]|uniref:Vasoactive intestinal polypeptide receptor 1 n=1 Tax=Echinops telfairi TaxID=9371 RepID=A0ABM1VLA0_ECHTE|nr:vasoactive intestinal polypeptide receptor 1 [Echinops telfairi]
MDEKEVSAVIVLRRGSEVRAQGTGGAGTSARPPPGSCRADAPLSHSWSGARAVRGRGAQLTEAPGELVALGTLRRAPMTPPPLIAFHRGPAWAVPPEMRNDTSYLVVRWARTNPPRRGRGRLAESLLKEAAPELDVKGALGPPTSWLCALASALACALSPADGQVAGLQREECIFLQEIELDHQQCLLEAQVENATAGCGKMWDNLTCWPATPLGQVVVMGCPPIFTLFSSSQGLNVSRNCTEGGWTQLEPDSYLGACGFNDNAAFSLHQQQQAAFYSAVKTGYTIGYSLSLAALLVAMAILSLFRKLHCTRNYIHMHLFTSFILRAAAVFIKDLALFHSGESDRCTDGSVGCKAAVVLFQYCVMANFFWLLVEGLYLHTLLAVSFFSERKYFWGYIVIGWGVPSTFIMVWTIVRIYFEDYGCWDTINSSLWWIIKAPILTSILVNFVLFICIIRILVQKLRPPEVGKKDSCPYSRLAKSTLLLIPLFGVHYIMFAFFPDNFKADVKLVFELVVGSFQGFLVAILYCFLNGEVQAELRRKWRRWHLQGFGGRNSKFQHPSGGSNGATCSTQVSMLTRVSPGARRSSSFQAEVSLL